MINLDKCRCRICKKVTYKVFCDLGSTPLANSYLSSQKQKENYYPLKVFFCNSCKFAQLNDHFLAKKIFQKYDYASSFSSLWLKHSKDYFKKIKKFMKLKKNSNICEIASNDGYLLQYFKNQNFNTLGIEPAKNIAKIAKKRGINTETLFFGSKVAKYILKKYGTQNLIIANNVLAHVPNICDFAKGINILLSKNGIVTIEFPHFYNLIKKYQFDTIYHEHFSYLSVNAAKKVFSKFNLNIFKVDKLNTHGGSVRIYLKKKGNKIFKLENSVKYFLNLEKKSKIFSQKSLLNFKKTIKEIKGNILNLLIKLKVKNKSIFAYGAAAKGNTFLNYCHLDNSVIDYIIDKSPYKIGKFSPGSKIPISDINKLKKSKPDYILILPWNLKDEILKEVKNLKIKSKFIIAIPKLKIFNENNRLLQ
jgi:2-polyprenyl-3-methyl-5-hydroxy-6-metoxy-1,4-benzoquinol methylase